MSCFICTLNSCKHSSTFLWKEIHLIWTYVEVCTCQGREKKFVILYDITTNFSFSFFGNNWLRKWTEYWYHYSIRFDSGKSNWFRVILLFNSVSVSGLHLQTVIQTCFLFLFSFLIFIYDKLMGDSALKRISWNEYKYDHKNRCIYLNYKQLIEYELPFSEFWIDDEARSKLKHQHTSKNKWIIIIK